MEPRRFVDDYEGDGTDWRIEYTVDEIQIMTCVTNELVGVTG